jgi:hypothetical protein
MLNDAWRIDLDTFVWSRISSLDLPTKLAHHSAAATPDGRMFVFGGYTDIGTCSATLYSTRITVP